MTTLQDLKPQAQGWVVMRFGLSGALLHQTLMQDPASIGLNLRVARQKAHAFFESLTTLAYGLRDAIAYLFPDHDIILLARPQSAEEKNIIQTLYRTLGGGLEKGSYDYNHLDAEFYTYQKFADHKFLMAQRMDAYEKMADSHKISSIGLRRKRRGYPLVMVVEDDRFTSSYAAHILNTNYEVTLARNGEQGIADYIDHAPDIVFLDINLPGLSGHDTLQSLRAVDSKAFIVMLSVDAVKQNIVKASQGGAYSFLRKPFSREKMIEMVKRSPFIQASLAHTPSLSGMSDDLPVH